MKEEIRETNLSLLISWFEALEKKSSNFQLDILEKLTEDALDKINKYQLD